MAISTACELQATGFCRLRTKRSRWNSGLASDFVWHPPLTTLAGPRRNPGARHTPDEL